MGKMMDNHETRRPKENSVGLFYKVGAKLQKPIFAHASTPHAALDVCTFPPCKKKVVMDRTENVG
jgi:hypothetical protein